jgi:hypothetical protein
VLVHVSHSEIETLKQRCTTSLLLLIVGEYLSIVRTGHNKMRYDLHTKFKIGTTSLCNSGSCNCGLADITAEHVLQEFYQLTDLPKDTKQTQVELAEKLSGVLKTNGKIHKTD